MSTLTLVQEIFSEKASIDGVDGSVTVQPVVELEWDFLSFNVSYACPAKRSLLVGAVGLEPTLYGF
jgi:hypothetical protein